MQLCTVSAASFAIAWSLIETASMVATQVLKSKDTNTWYV